MKEFLNKIMQKPHWQVIIRPIPFKNDRILYLTDCYKVIESCTVRLRGWDYPYTNEQDRINGTDWVESKCESGPYNEYWRFYQSGQFIHYFTFWEDNDDDAKKTAERQIRFGKSSDPSGYNDVLSTLATTKEIFEFAARLGEKKIFESGAEIGINLVNVNNRILFIWNLWRIFSYAHYCNINTINFKKNYSTEELLGKSSELALETATFIFERFNWNDVRSESMQKILSEDQKKIIAE